MTVLQHRIARRTYASTHSIELEPAADRFEQWTNQDALLRLLDEYFMVAQQSAAGLVRIRWSARQPHFVLVWPAVLMINMGEPTFEETAGRRAIRVAVQGGLLVSPVCKASLSIAFTYGPDSLWASVELRDYMPRGGHIAVVDWLYRQTQVRMHEWVGLRYVRLLRRRWLAESYRV